MKPKVKTRKSKGWMTRLYGSHIPWYAWKRAKAELAFYLSQNPERKKEPWKAHTLFIYGAHAGSALYIGVRFGKGEDSLIVTLYGQK